MNTETTEHPSARDGENGAVGDSGNSALLPSTPNPGTPGSAPPSRPFVPRLVTCLRGYSRQDFAHDLVAGFTVGLVALPLAMAFGIASGVTPQAGIYTAVVGGFLVSALGGSRIQIGGPTGAFVVIVAGIVAQVRPFRPADGHDDGRRDPAAGHGRHRAGHGGASSFRGRSPSASPTASRC